ncbi:MAG: Rossmann-like and DUF2520 domain-containing protein [Burkholderiales bacterium]
MAILNIIGGGRAGRTLARVFAQAGAFAVGDVCDCSSAVAADAVAFIGAGRAIDAIARMRGAAVWMLTPPDDQIVACGRELNAAGLLKAGDVIFHCSGALPSRDLAAALPSGMAVASVHPLKSFGDPALAAQTFDGTYCAAEGDASALALLKPAFERSGARVFEIDPAFKTIYHAASVIVCNYLNALLETGLRSYEKSGIRRDDALRMMEPLVRETLDNIFRRGTAAALTGPIARGDSALVSRQVDALDAWDPRIAAIYRQLGAITVELARAQGGAAAPALDAIEIKLAGETPGRP